MMKRLFSLLALVALSLSSCENEEIKLDPDKSGQAYYPLEIGTFWVFDVTETVYTNNVGQTEEFQIRERIDQITTDQSGREWYRVEISRRSTENDNWRVLGVKMLSKSQTDFRITQNNQTLVHMIYPAKNGKSWVANAFNTSEEDLRYFYDKIGEDFIVEDKRYPNTLTVSLAAENNLLEFDEQIEVLAYGVGPVYRSNVAYEYCNDMSLCEVGIGYIVTGKDRKETLVETGIID